MNELSVRKTPKDLLKLKESVLKQFKEFEAKQKEIDQTLEEFRMHTPFRVENRIKFFGKDAEIKWIDQKCWTHLVELYELHKYMSCTEFKKLQEDLENGNFPEFTEENLESWMFDLKNSVKEQVKSLLEKVYEDLINKVYYTGGKKKKRNNKGLDSRFIIYTYDYESIFGYSWNHISITDDLEKACYLLDGKKLPEITIKSQMRADKNHEAQNEYFKIKVCQNGNTHFTVFKDTLEKLNKYGTDGSKIGENIKIKVFEGRW